MSSATKEVTELARLLQEACQTEPYDHMAFVATVPQSDLVCMAHAGSPRALEQVIEGLKALQGRLEQVIRERTSGVSSGLGNLHEWNLAVDPINFDFVPWLAGAEMIRRREGAPAPLLVRFTNEHTLGEQGRSKFNQILRPMLSLVGAIEDKSSDLGWRKAECTFSPLVHASKRGEEVVKFKAPEHDALYMRNWLHGQKPPITITLREAEHCPYRNSQLDAWLQFARDRMDEGENIVFVRDTAKGNELIPGFTTCPHASFDIRRRMALYEQSKLNLFVSNGPATLCFLSDAPYLCFNLPGDGEQWHCDADWWKQFNGMSVGEQWPWAGRRQKIVWQHDTYENISKAYEEWKGTQTNSLGKLNARLLGGTMHAMRMH